jgi:hypothetical protein
MKYFKLFPFSQLKHFEPIWGEKHDPTSDSTPLLLSSPVRPSIKTTIKMRPSTSASIRHSKIVPRRPRTVGAVTRAITNYWVQEEADSTADKPPSPAEKRPADQYEGNGEENELHKKLRPLSSSAGITLYLHSNIPLLSLIIIIK